MTVQYFKHRDLIVKPVNRPTLKGSQGIESLERGRLSLECDDLVELVDEYFGDTAPNGKLRPNLLINIKLHEYSHSS